MSDSFLHKHQASLDSQREEAAINWRFPQDDEEEIEDKDFPVKRKIMTEFVPITRYSRCKRYSGAVIKCPECH